MENKDRKIRIGIIGTGGIAHSHMLAYLNQPDVEVVAGCDIIEGKAAAFFKEFGLENVKTNYKNDEEMLADKSLNLDGVSICTYNRQHAPCAIHALEAGMNVLLEKPFTVTLDDAVKIMKAEKKSGKILTIGFQPRFHENVKMIKKIVDSGALGKIYYIQTGGGRRAGIPNYHDCSFIKDETAGIGALGDIGCYSLDLVLNAIGYPKPLTASGFTSDLFGKSPDYYKEGEEYCAEKFSVDDFGAGFVRLEGGIILDFRISWAMNMDTAGDTLILGTKAGLKIPSTPAWNGDLGGNLKLYKKEFGQQIEIEIPKLKSENIWHLKIRSFIDAIKNGTPAPVPSSEIIYNQAIIDGILRSSKLGKEVEIKIPKI